MKKKIAIYSGEIPSTTFIENLIEAVAENNNTVLLFGNMKKQVSYNNSNIYLFPFPKSFPRLLIYVIVNHIKLFYKSKVNLNRLFRHTYSTGKTFRQRLHLYAKYLPVIINMPDIFHVQWTNAANEWVFLKDLFGVKIVVSLRGAQINIAPIVNKPIGQKYHNIFPSIDRFHAVARAISKEATKYGAPSEKINVVYSGIDFEKINLFEKTDYHISKIIKVISVGRVHWKKGYNYGLDGMSRIKKAFPEFQYTIITDSLREELLFQTLDLGMNDNIKVSDRMSQQEVFKLMQQSDFLLLPSVEEGIANVVLEAMALGLPVVSSDCGGMGEVIDHGINGFLYRNRDPEDMAKNIMSLINLSVAERAALANAGKLKVTEQHQKGNLGLEMNKLYDNVLCA